MNAALTKFEQSMDTNVLLSEMQRIKNGWQNGEINLNTDVKEKETIANLLKHIDTLSQGAEAFNNEMLTGFQNWISQQRQTLKNIVVPAAPAPAAPAAPAAAAEAPAEAPAGELPPSIQPPMIPAEKSTVGTTEAAPSMTPQQYRQSLKTKGWTDKMVQDYIQLLQEGKFATASSHHIRMIRVV